MNLKAALAHSPLPPEVPTWRMPVAGVGSVLPTLKHWHLGKRLLIGRSSAREELWLYPWNSWIRGWASPDYCVSWQIRCRGTRADLGFCATSVFSQTCGGARGLASFCQLMIDGGQEGGVAVPKFSFLPWKNFALYLLRVLKTHLMLYWGWQALKTFLDGGT